MKFVSETGLTDSPAFNFGLINHFENAAFLRFQPKIVTTLCSQIAIIQLFTFIFFCSFQRRKKENQNFYYRRLDRVNFGWIFTLIAISKVADVIGQCCA